MTIAELNNMSKEELVSYVLLLKEEIDHLTGELGEVEYHYGAALETIDILSDSLEPEDRWPLKV
jgi:hypothetical protein